MRYAILLLAACEPAAPPVQPGVRAPAPAFELDARFVPAIKETARHYTEWGRVDDVARVAPAPCAAPTAANETVERTTPSPARLSSAADGPHSKKLYFLWTNQRDEYLNADTFRPGFAIVKQSFEAVPGDEMKVGPPKDLFVMTKVAARAGTDGGWVYGTVAVDGTVTSAGRVPTCMKCHDHDATHEKLFAFGLR